MELIMKTDDYEIKEETILKYILSTKRCACCGKEFGCYIWEEYVYKRKNPIRFYCSWSCYRKEEEKIKRMYIKERRVRKPKNVSYLCNSQQREQ